MIPELASSGHLPVGRFRATEDEVRARYVDSPVYAGSGTRAEIWDHWLTASGHLRNMLPVCAAWLGGSFLSNKTDPDDLDVILIVDGRNAFDLRIKDPSAAKFLYLCSKGDMLRKMRGWRLDTFVMEWPLSATPAVLPISHTYHGTRGYWDDFWQRVRTGPKGTTYLEDALPRRGYLEVILDDWET